MRKMSTEKALVLIFSAFILVFGYGVYNLFQPDHFPMKFIRGEVTQVDEDLLLGPYPSSKELLKLKRMGVSVMINLMNPDFQVEAPLIKEINRRCEKYGLSCVSFPLSFLKMESESNRLQIDALIDYLRSTPGKKYIHCYLGRHRVRLVREQLEGTLYPSQAGFENGG